MLLMKKLTMKKENSNSVCGCSPRVAPKSSGEPGAGMGLFAVREGVDGGASDSPRSALIAFSAGEAIVEYTGKIHEIAHVAREQVLRT